MACFKCHTGPELHGMNADGEPVDKTERYDGAPVTGLYQLPSGRSGWQERDHAAQYPRREAGMPVCHSVGRASCYSCVQKN